jgi:hypothetical protein
MISSLAGTPELAASAYVAGSMFWFIRKKFSGSYYALIRARRS